MLPFAELFVPFDDTSEIEAKNQILTLEWKSIGRDLVFRPRGAPLTTLWFYTNVSTSPLRPRRGEVSSSTRTGVLAKRLSLGYKRRDFKRLVPLPGHNWQDTPEIWLRVAPHMVTVMGHGSKYGGRWNVPFSFPGDKLAFLSAPLDDFLRVTQHHIQSNPNEWEEALQWMRWDDETRFWSLVTWKRGDVVGWKALLKALLRLAHRHQKLSKIPIFRRVHWAIKISATAKAEIVAPLELSGSYLDVHWKILPTLKQLLVLVQAYFSPQVDLSRSRVSSTYPLRDILTGGSIVVEDADLSQHEILECVQTWREFGRKSGQLAQVESCLRQLLA